MLRAIRSRDVSADQASVAALLGPSEAGFGDFRELLVDLSLGFPDRRVVLIVYLSGLGDRIVAELSDVFPFDETFCTGAKRLVLESPFLLLMLPTTATSEDGRGGIGGLRFTGFWGTVGRDSSEYVTAGIVPCPISPLKLGPESGVSTNLESLSLDVGAGTGTVVFSSLDTRNASSKSMRSLHCNSNSFRASISAFSVSVRDAYNGRALFAL